MPLMVYILDSRPAYVHGRLSLLQMPLGAGTLFSRLRAQTAALRPDCTHILATFPMDPEYSSGAVDCPVLWAGERAEAIARCEPSDTLLLIDPRFYPIGGMPLSTMLADRHDYRWAAHAVALPSQGDASERVFLALDGSVECIRRYYDGVTWPHRGDICCTRVSAAALQGIEIPSFTRLAELRHALAARSVFSQDVALWPDAVDLGREEGLLALNEKLLRRAGGGWRRGDLRGAGLASSVRVSGPLLVHEDAIIGADVVLVGPTVIGAGARIGQGALIAQSIVAPGAVVAAGGVVRQRVWCAGQAGGVNGLHPGSHGAARRHSYRAPPLRMIAGGSQRRRCYEAVKRGIDALAALLGLIVLSPLLLLISFLVRATSRGPAWFAHEREGRNGGVFSCYKFRTMRDGAHAEQRALYGRSTLDGPQFKLPGDPRITGVGRFLRSTNLDELPQLMNVVRGHMSLIGPRPSPFRENQLCVPWRRARLSVRPGITGLWQICRHARCGSDFHQWIHYDTLYVRHMSAWLDFKILLATLLTLGGRWTVPLSWMISETDPYVTRGPERSVNTARAG